MKWFHYLLNAYVFHQPLLVKIKNNRDKIQLAKSGKYCHEDRK